MGKINWNRVILGGLLAGVILNVFDFLFFNVFMVKQAEAALHMLGRSMDNSARAIVIWIVLDFIIGITLVWVYAAARPGLGAGAGTAIKVGFAVWIFAGLLMTVSMWNLHLLPAGLMLSNAIWMLVGVTLAALLGAWLYKEA